MRPDFEPPPSVPLKLVNLLKKARKVLLASHHNPDGDALGSMAALALGLNQLGVETKFYLDGHAADNLKFLWPASLEAIDRVALENFQALILLDCHLFSRLGEQGPALECRLKALGPRGPATLVIDHHQYAQPWEAESAYLVPEASSTGELVFNVLAALNVELTREIAESLWVALVSDTGNFNFSNTTMASLSQASALLAAGVEPWPLAQRLSHNQPPRKLKLLGAALTGLRLELSGRVAMLVVTEDMLAETGAQLADTEGFVDYPRSLAGVEVAALIYPLGKGFYKVSLRARTDFDVSLIAKCFGGGGHRQAAAYEDPGPAGETVNRFLAKTAELWAAAT